MNTKRFFAIMFLLSLFSVNGCAIQENNENTVAYPRMPKDTSERKAGRAMLFYEAAENDADPNQVIVIPPDGDAQ